MNLNQVTVPSLDVPKSIAFYEKLGLKLIVHTHDKYARFECPDGDSTFSIHEVSKLSTGEAPVIYFECENLDKHVKHLQAKGIAFQELPNDKDWLWREAHLYDPYGNHLILYKAANNRKNPPWRKKD
ncbi:VOC family protein [Ekhidna sp.]|jgi:catechol 2,3-dioxygenase-like lactoylglutathione lyase family enzyme|uniref:VOC family protein n=1 Tax=Ekhidna sp. TaxID=2608089 RepID=UPI0032F02EEA